MPPPTDDSLEVRRLRDRLRVLSDAVRAFTESATDYPRLLTVVARNVAEVVRDYCGVLLLSEDGRELHLVATHDRDPNVVTLFTELVKAEPLVLATHGMLRRLVDTGEPVFVPRVDAEALRPHTTALYHAFLKGMGIHGVLAVRLVAHGRVLGVLSLGRFREDTPTFDESDCDLAQSLADHAALAISNARSNEAERAALDALDATAEAYRHLFEASPVPMYFIDAETLRVLEVNRAALALYGYTREEFLARTVPEFRPAGEEAKAREQFRSAGEADVTGSVRHRRKDGSTFDLRYSSRMLTLGGTRGRLAVLEDVSAREELEQQVRQSQKMEAIGRLAGGVAHDFNNLLSVILSYADLLAAELSPGQPLRADVEEIQRAAHRASELTQRLLSFSRQQVLAPRVLDLNHVLTDMGRMLRRILGEDVQVVSVPAPDLGRVRVDPASIEQIIMNLAVNARDAMPKGGKLTLETANVTLTGDYARERPGPYVMLAITDTGTGMDRATLDRIFEPFFTTKERGKGTGLGLATVFGIVRQSGGYVWPYSEPGKGATFKLYFPRVDAEEEPIRPPRPAVAPGTETILLVEDEEQIRVVARRILIRDGYQVLEAGNGNDALSVWKEHGGSIDLLLTDVVMPEMSGPDLARQLAATCPALKVLFMSGYTDDAVVRHGVLEGEVAFLQKPFTPSALGAKVREVLDANSEE